MEVKLLSKRKILWRHELQTRASRGASVAKARALYAFVDADYVFDERILCNNEGINFRQLANNIENDVSAFLLYPNPTSEKITIEYSIGTNKNCVIEICDVFGREVKMISLNSNITTIDVSSFAVGTYICKLRVNQLYRHFAKFSIVK